MRIHLENPRFYSHAIAAWALPMGVIRCAPWSDDASGVFGVCDAAANARASLKLFRSREIERKGLHLVWAENLITDMSLAGKWPAGHEGALHGPTMQDLAIGCFKNTLGAANLCTRVEPGAAVLRDSNATKLGLMWVDLEEFPNPGNQDKYPGVWTMLRTLCSGDGDVEITRRVRAAVYCGLRRGLAAMGLDADLLVCWECADRPTGWAHNDTNTPALGVPTPRPHLIYTTGHSSELNRIRRELRGGSGASRAVVHLSTLIDPAHNRRLLSVCADEGVPDVILYADVTIPDSAGGDAALSGKSRQQVENMQRAAAVPRLDAHVSVVREFAGRVEGGASVGGGN